MKPNLESIKNQIQYNAEHVALLQGKSDKKSHLTRLAARNLAYLVEQAEMVPELKRELSIERGTRYAEAYLTKLERQLARTQKELEVYRTGMLQAIGILLVQGEGYAANKAYQILSKAMEEYSALEEAK